MPTPDDSERILVVDDSKDTLEVLQRNLTSEGYQVFTAPGVAEAITILEGTPVDLVITALKMPKVSGLDLVRHVRENYKDTEVMMITGYATIGGAVEAVKTGAEEYLPKPFTDEELIAAVARAIDKLRLRRIGQAEVSRIRPPSHGLVGESGRVGHATRYRSANGKEPRLAQNAVLVKWSCRTQKVLSFVTVKTYLNHGKHLNSRTS